MTPKLKFAEGEKVLCFHGPLIYEAKALKSTITKDKQIKYYIHYAGWNKNWDEWVPENRVLKYNEVNVQKQKEVFKQHSSAASRTKKATPKGKKNESVSSSKDGTVSGSSESRASTPSKEVSSTTLAAPATSGRSRTKSSTNAINSTSSASVSSVSTPTSSATPTSTTAVTTATSGDTTAALTTNNSLTTNSITTNAAALNTNTTTTTFSTTTTTAASIINSHDVKDGDSYKKKRSRTDLAVESEELFLSKVEVKVRIPDELKPCLVDDWDAITRQHKLIDIPAKITVQDIVDNYISFKKSSKSTNASKEFAITDVANGLVEYFNVMLGSQLLYKFERQQYAELLQQHPDVPLSKLYGSFHLLRLFVRIGSMLAFTALDEKSTQTLLGHLNDFLKFLVKNCATYFNMSNFVNVSPEYHRNTQ